MLRENGLEVSGEEKARGRGTKGQKQEQVVQAKVPAGRNTNSVRKGKGVNGGGEGDVV